MWQSVTLVSKGAAGFINLFPQWRAQNQVLDSEMIFRTWKSLELKTEGWKKLGFMLWNLVYNLCRKADVSQGENTTCRSNAVGYTRSTISSQGRRLWSRLSLPYWEHWIARQTQQQQPRSSHKKHMTHSTTPPEHPVHCCCKSPGKIILFGLDSLFHKSGIHDQGKVVICFWILMIYGAMGRRS